MHFTFNLATGRKVARHRLRNIPVLLCGCMRLFGGSCLLDESQPGITRPIHLSIHLPTAYLPIHLFIHPLDLTLRNHSQTNISRGNSNHQPIQSMHCHLDVEISHDTRPQRHAHRGGPNLDVEELAFHPTWGEGEHCLTLWSLLPLQPSSSSSSHPHILLLVIFRPQGDRPWLAFIILRARPYGGGAKWNRPMARIYLGFLGQNIPCKWKGTDSVIVLNLDKWINNLFRSSPTHPTAHSNVSWPAPS